MVGFLNSDLPVLKDSSFKLVRREEQSTRTIVEVQGVRWGETEVVIIAGPCAVESDAQMLETARAVKASGAKVLRGGTFKPRTSPYSFQGLKEEGLIILARARQTTGLPIVTEVMDARHLDMVCQYADILQVGSRNMQNFTLLEEVGRSSKPVLLKRGLSATIEEFLLAAEYISTQGNGQIILCERGIRTFETATKYTLDLNAIPLLKQLSHLPVIVDPSHGTGHWWMVPSLAKAAIAVGADGLIIEVHPHPEEALSDGPQSLRPDKFGLMMEALRGVWPRRWEGRYRSRRLSLAQSIIPALQY